MGNNLWQSPRATAWNRQLLCKVWVLPGDMCWNKLPRQQRTCAWCFPSCSNWGFSWILCGVIWVHLGTPWSQESRELSMASWQGWSWDGVGMGSQALQPDTSTGRRENTVKSSHMERDPTCALGNRKTFSLGCISEVWAWAGNSNLSFGLGVCLVSWGWAQFRGGEMCMVASFWGFVVATWHNSTVILAPLAPDPSSSAAAEAFSPCEILFQFLQELLQVTISISFFFRNHKSFRRGEGGIDSACCKSLMLVRKHCF